MHEASIAKGIVNTVENLALKHGFQNFENLKVLIGVGELAGVTFEELEPFLKRLKPCWVFKSKIIPAICHCSCGFKGKPKVLLKAHDLVVYECPECGAIPELKQGGDVTILSIRQVSPQA